MRKINVPAITSIENALRIYYENSEIGNSQIIELFGKRSPTTISRLKELVKDEMRSQNKSSFGANRVNTEIAYQVWGIDVVDLEFRMKKLNELRLCS